MKHLNFNNIAIALLMVIVVISLYKMQKLKENYRVNQFDAQLTEEVYEKILGGLIVGEGRKITNSEFLVLDRSIDTLEIESTIQKNKK